MLRGACESLPHGASDQRLLASFHTTRAQQTLLAHSARSRGLSVHLLSIVLR
jgi:hypothetical protein